MPLILKRVEEIYFKGALYILTFLYFIFIYYLIKINTLALA